MPRQTVDAAEEALRLIEVDYEELPAVLDVHEALKSGAALVHDSIKLPTSGFADLAEIKPVEGTNICTHFKLNRGDIEKGFAEADHIFEDTFTLPATQHCFLETHACIASAEPGRITVWATTQNPFVVRTQLANIFKVPVSKVRVIVPYLGGGYGGKVYPKVEPITVALAQKARRPVRVVLSREEVFYTITKHAAVIRMKTGVKNDGTLIARECEIHLDTGAYAEIGPRVAKKSGYTAAGPYRIPNLKIDSYSVYTNKPPAGAFRGFGVSQSAWAVESQMDIMAAALKIDPLELRLKNGYVDGDRFVTEETLRSVGLKDCLHGVAKSIGWEEEQPFNEFNRSSFKWNEPEARQGVGVHDQGDDHAVDLVRCVKAQRRQQPVLYIAARWRWARVPRQCWRRSPAKNWESRCARFKFWVSIPMSCPYDLTTSSSRSTFHMGKAVQLAAQDILRQLKDIVVEEYGVPADQVSFVDGKYACPRARSIMPKSCSRRFGMQGGTLIGEGQVKTSVKDEFGEKEHFGILVLAAGAAEVEVDMDTGKFKLLKYATAVDVGKALNPLGCRQQLTGAAITGIGQAVFEEIAYDNGQLINPNLVDYVLPSLG